MKEPDSTIVVRFELKANSQSAFNYVDKYGNFKQVLFDKVPGDTSFLKIFTSKSPFEFYYSFGFKIPFILIPGDTVTFVAAKRTIHAVSKKSTSAEINFFQALDKSHQSIFEYERIFHSIPLPQRLFVLDSLYRNSVAFLENQKNGLSAELYSIYSSMINYEYLRFKLTRFAVDKNSMLRHFTDSIANLIEDDKYFLNELIGLLNFYNNVKWGTDFSDPNYNTKMYDSSYNFYRGKIRDRILLAELTGIKNKAPKFLEEYLAKFDKQCGDPDLKRFAKENFAGEKAILANELTNHKSESTSWAKLLESQKGKVIYIDFWASWCVPCRKEMPGAKELIKAFDGDAFSYVFISIDDLPTSWKEACIEESLNSHKLNYLLLGSNQSKINKLLNITSIPRYVLINKKGEIVDQNAPPPLEMIKNNAIRKLLKG